MAVFSTGESLKTMIATQEGVLELDDMALAHLQQVEAAILSDIIRICGENNLVYMLGGGSCLGAVRHHGFIPWDDDVDMNMPRIDCDTLVSLLRARYADEYDVLVPGETDDYGLAFIQVRKRGTVAVKQEDFLDGPCGVPIDIFPIESMYDNALRRAFHGIRCLLSGYKLACCRVYQHRDGYRKLAEKEPDLRKNLERKIRFGRLYPSRSLKSCAASVARTYSACRDQNSTMVGIPSGRKHFFGELYRRDQVFPPQTFLFEDMDCGVPADYESYLSSLYGEWKRIPEENEREHHYYVKLDI